MPLFAICHPGIPLSHWFLGAQIHDNSFCLYFWTIESNHRDFPGGPVVKNAGDAGSTPGWRTKIPHATGQLSLCVATTESACSGARAPQLDRPRAANYRACALWSPWATTREKPAHRIYRACVLWSLCTTTREKPAHRNEEPMHHNDAPMLRAQQRSHLPQLRPDVAK